MILPANAAAITVRLCLIENLEIFHIVLLVYLPQGPCVAFHPLAFILPVTTASSSCLQGHSLLSDHSMAPRGWQDHYESHATTGPCLMRRPHRKKEMQALLSHLKKWSQHRQLLTRVCCSLWIVQRTAFYLFIPYYQCVKYSHLPWPLYRQFRLTGATSLKNGSEKNKRQSSSTSTKYAVALASYRELHSTYLSHITNESGILSCLDHSMESLGWQGLTRANRA